MNHVKIIAKGWAGYTGLLGMHHFKDGVSVEPLSRPQIDQLAAVVQMVEITPEGEEVGAGVARRLVTDSAMRAPVRQKVTEVQTPAERAKEDQNRIEKGFKAPVEKFYTKEELEAIVDKGGIKALREIAEPWGVKARQIVELMHEILAAQSKFETARQAGLEAIRAKAEAEAAAQQPPAVPADPTVA